MWTWLRRNWWVPLAGLAAVLGFRWFWDAYRQQRSLEGIERTRVRIAEMQRDVAQRLEIATLAAEDRAESAAELEVVRSSIRKAEAENGALSAIDVAESFNRRARLRER